MNIFERAARARLRFVAPNGHLTVEQLFQLPLTDRRGGPSLDEVGRKILTDLESFSRLSLVEEEPKPEKIELELKLEIVKHIIASKKADQAAAATRAAKAEERRKLSELLAKKQDAKLEGMSEEEILKKLEELDK